MAETYKYTLTGSSIDEIAEKLDAYLGTLKMDSGNRTRIRLSVEDILLKWRDHFGEETLCRMKTGVRFGRPYLSLEVQGASFDPLREEDEFGDWSKRMLGNIGLVPVYSYENGLNTVTLRLKKPRRNPIIGLIGCICAAILTGILGKFLLPQNVISIALDNVIAPVYDTFLGILGCIAGPMVFLAVAWGIYSIGDLSTLGRIGKRMLTRFIGTALLMTSFAAAASLLLFKLKFSATGTSSSQLWSIFQLILDFFPTDIISPLMNGNTLQIILMAVMVGGALLVLSKQTKAVAALIEQINYIVQYLVELISLLVPFFIFIVLVQIIWSGSYNVVVEAWKPFAAFFLIAALILVFRFVYTGRANKVSPLLLVRKCLETFVVALTTASSTAAFGAASSCCEKKLGIHNNLVSFGIPLGIVFYPAATAIYFLLINFYMAECYAVEISIVWMLIAVFISTILAIASPPIPGGTLTCYTVMFLQLGIPTQALAVTLALDVLFDFIATALNMVLLELELTQQAKKLNMLNQNLLQKASSR